MAFENVIVPAGTKVVVLMGGDSAEREVSLNTGAQVAEALSSQGLEVTTVDASESDFIASIQGASPDAVFVCLHGRDGEDGTVQGLLELLDIPYVGSGVLASALAMDKVMSKHFFAHSDISTPDYVALRRGEPYDVAEITERLGDKTVAKPANEGSAIGVTISHTSDELPAAIETAFVHDDLVLVEAFVAGVEVTVGVLGNDEVVALPTIEIIAEHEFYDYESKYVTGMSEHIIPARIPQSLVCECEALAIRAHEILGCRGMSRSDMIVTSDGEVELLEINTIPGMTSTSLLPDAARAGGLEFPRLCEVLVGLALEG
ncbi:MAG: D-alanine--D-alanine ligase [Actinomycetota bacterium]|nr:D-alanine--D-alanine ligase [Actinomycetota bacterium]